MSKADTDSVASLLHDDAFEFLGYKLTLVRFANLGGVDQWGGGIKSRVIVTSPSGQNWLAPDWDAARQSVVDDFGGYEAEERD